MKREPTGPLLATIFRLAAAVTLARFMAVEAIAQSALDGFDPGANNIVRALAVQADGKILVGGDFTMLGGGEMGSTPRNFMGRLNPDGTLDISFDPNANGTVLALAVQADGKIVVVGNFTTLGVGTARNFIARLNPGGDLDMDFNPNADAGISAVALQPDGKIVVGGNFSTIGGSPVGAVNRIARLNPDGSLDANFNPGANDTVQALALQPDGRILVGGFFTTLGGGGMGVFTRNFIGRLNPDGAVDTGFDPGANSFVNTLAVQADGRILVGGDFTFLGNLGTAPRNFIGRLNPDGGPDDSFNPGANGDLQSVLVQPDGKILAGGFFTTLGDGGTTTRAFIGRLNQIGTPDSFDPGANNLVFALAAQADGKILVGGQFSALGGGTGTVTRNNIGRLYANGALDTNFDPGTSGLMSGDVRTIAVQADGKIVVGGSFDTLSDESHNHIGRLDLDGAVETNFSPDRAGDVRTVAVQADGKILVGGLFNIQGGDTLDHIGRLNPDGMPDDNFNQNASTDGNVVTLALQADGNILIGGGFFNVGSGNIPRNHIARLIPDGSVDPFNPNADAGVFTIAVQADGQILLGGAFDTVDGGGTAHIARVSAGGIRDSNFNPLPPNGNLLALVVQPDGKILAAGQFTQVGDQITNFIARFNTDGMLDSNFLDSNADLEIDALALQTDGKILISGDFTQVGGATLIGRLNPDGTPDDSFIPGAMGEAVATVALQADGKVLAGGTFTKLGNAGQTSRNNIGRLTNTDAAFQLLIVSASGTVITWLRGGASPEVDRVTFELATDGIAFEPLPDPSRIDGGWQLTDQSLPTLQNLVIRARGYYSTGGDSGSGSIVESVRNVFITPVPVIDSILTATTPVGQPFFYQITATNSPTTFNATPLPAGLTIDTGTGMITGSPTGGGSFAVTLSATNAGGTGTAVLTLNVTPFPPVITSSLSEMAKVCVPFTYQIVATNNPTSFGAAPLPPGLTFAAQSGTITGTPTASGTFLVSISAANAGGIDTEILTLDVALPDQPVITSSLTATATTNTFFSYQIAASNCPTSFAASPLPPGLTVDNIAGLISGTPSTAGSFNITLNASNAGGTGTAVLALTITLAQPVITSSLSPTGTVGQSFSYQITATNAPTSYGATGLPAPLTVNTSTGLISGTPAAAGTFPLTLSATNSGGIGSALATLTINGSSPPVFFSPMSAITTVGLAFSYQPEATGAPTFSVDETTLPPWLKFDPELIALVGIPTIDGVFDIKLIASNQDGTTTKILELTVRPAPTSGPTIISTTSATGRTGTYFDFQVLTSGGGPDAQLTADGLPPGLTFDPSSGQIFGTQESDGSSLVTLTASNGSQSTLQLTFTSDRAVPVIISSNTAELIPGQSFTYQIVADGGANLSYAVVGDLPDGLSLDKDTGIISGTFGLAAGTRPRPDVTGGVITNVAIYAIDSSSGAVTLKGTNQLVFFLRSTGARNISTRAYVDTGDRALIAGFIIRVAPGSTPAPMKLVLRAIGPSLLAAKTPVPNPLANPFLSLHYLDPEIAANDDWKDNLSDPMMKKGTQEMVIEATSIPPTNSLESAVLAVLNPGAYTAIVSGTAPTGTNGVGLVEVYNIATQGTADGTDLANISTRGYVQTGANVMIGGFIHNGSTSVTVVLRAIGPSLASAGVKDTLSDPALDLNDANGNIIATNDDWKTNSTADQAIITQNDLDKSGGSPISDLESVIVATLPPNTGDGTPYTATVRGSPKNTNPNGIGLVEAYFLP